MPRILLALLAAAAVAAPALAQGPKFDRKEDVIYGRKYGTALTLDVFTPKEKPNGAGVIFCVSGGWFSSHDKINVGLLVEFLKRGYVCFAVVHGSQPKFTIPEVLEDMHRAVRFIRHHAKEYGVDQDRLGITGGSAGGHLSLMMGTAGKDGDPKAEDPVDRQSSKVAAVGCFFPPTDFLNYGKEGADSGDTLKGFQAPFDFHTLNPETRVFDPVTDPEKRKAIMKAISPCQQVTKSSAPTLIIHGDMDKLVPLQQSERIIERFKAEGVPCDLVVKAGGDHGWPGMNKDLVTIADWFDKHTAKKEK